MGPIDETSYLLCSEAQRLQETRLSSPKRRGPELTLTLRPDLRFDLDDGPFVGGWGVCPSLCRFRGGTARGRRNGGALGERKQRGEEGGLSSQRQGSEGGGEAGTLAGSWCCVCRRRHLSVNIKTTSSMARLKSPSTMCKCWKSLLSFDLTSCTHPHAAHNNRGHARTRSAANPMQTPITRQRFRRVCPKSHRIRHEAECRDQKAAVATHYLRRTS